VLEDCIAGFRIEDVRILRAGNRESMTDVVIYLSSVQSIEMAVDGDTLNELLQAFPPKLFL